MSKAVQVSAQVSSRCMTISPQGADLTTGQLHKESQVTETGRGGGSSLWGRVPFCLQTTSLRGKSKKQNQAFGVIFFRKEAQSGKERAKLRRALCRLLEGPVPRMEGPRGQGVGALLPTHPSKCSSGRERRADYLLKEGVSCTC